MLASCSLLVRTWGYDRKIWSTLSQITQLRFVSSYREDFRVLLPSSTKSEHMPTKGLDAGSTVKTDPRSWLSVTPNLIVLSKVG